MSESRVPIPGPGPLPAHLAARREFDLARMKRGLRWAHTRGSVSTAATQSPQRWWNGSPRRAA